MIMRLRVWLWERRLVHARAAYAGLEREFCREVARAKHDVEYCERMAAQARMEAVRQRADAAKALRARWRS